MIRYVQSGLACALTAGLTFAMVPGGLNARIIPAVFAAAVMAVLLCFSRRRDVTKLMDQLEREGHVTLQAATAADIKISANGVTMTMSHDTVDLPWAAVDAVEHTPQAVEIWSKDGRLVSIPKHAFDSPEAAAAFLDESRRHHAAASRRFAP